MFRHFDSVFTNLLAERILLACPTRRMLRLGVLGGAFHASSFAALDEKRYSLYTHQYPQHTGCVFACQRIRAGDFMVFFLILQMPLPRIPMDLCFRLIAKQKGEHLLTKSLPSGSILILPQS